MRCVTPRRAAPRHSAFAPLRQAQHFHPKPVALCLQFIRVRLSVGLRNVPPLVTQSAQDGSWGPSCQQGSTGECSFAARRSSRSALPAQCIHELDQRPCRCPSPGAITRLHRLHYRRRQRSRCHRHWCYGGRVRDEVREQPAGIHGLGDCPPNGGRNRSFAVRFGQVAFNDCGNLVLGLPI